MSSCQKLVKMDLCQHPSFLLWSKEWGKRGSGTAQLVLFSMAFESLGELLSQKHEFVVPCTSFLSRLVHKWSVINWLLGRSYYPVGSRARKLTAEELNLSPPSYERKFPSSILKIDLYQNCCLEKSLHSLAGMINCPRFESLGRYFKINAVSRSESAQNSNLIFFIHTGSHTSISLTICRCMIRRVGLYLWNQSALWIRRCEVLKDSFMTAHIENFRICLPEGSPKSPPAAVVGARMCETSWKTIFWLLEWWLWNFLLKTKALWSMLRN